MRILAIRGQNLASLARTFAVDLADGPLRHVGLFAITGPVGAGKSTLLDALCLALFDRTPRLSNRGGVPVGDTAVERSEWLRSNDPRTLLRRDAAEGWAEVDFSGRDGGRYRARWSVRRARRKPDGRVQDQEMSLVDLDREVVVAKGRKTEVLAAIERRLGLDFGQFCRSVLLAQGEFAAFLRASADERARLLENLTGADVYRRLSRAAHERRRAQEKRVDVLRAQFVTQPLLDADARAALEHERARLANEHATCVAGVDLAQQYVNWYAAAARREEEEGAATVVLQAAIARHEAAAPRRQILQRLQTALTLLPHWQLVQQRRVAARIAVAAADGAARARERADADVVGARHALRPALRAAFGEVEVAPPVVRDFVRAEPLLARRVDATTRLQELARQRPALLAAQQHAEANVPVARERAAALAAEQAAATARALAAERATADPELLRLVQRRQAAAVARAQQERAVRGLDEAVAAAAAARTAGERVRDGAAVRERLAAEFVAPVAARAEAEQRLRAARHDLDHARSVAGLEALRAQLVDGEPCPLCGAHEHPMAGAPPQDVVAAERLAAAAQRAFDAALQEVAQGEAHRRQAEAALAAAIAEHERLQVAARRARAAWLPAVGDEGADPDAMFVVAREGLERQLAACADEEAAVAALDERARALAVDFAAAVAAAAVANERLHAARTAERAAEREALTAADAVARALADRDGLEAILADQVQSLAAAFAGADDWVARLAAGGSAWLDAVRRAHELDGRLFTAEQVAAEAQRQQVDAASIARRLVAETEQASVVLAEAVGAAGGHEDDVAEAARVGAAELAREADELAELARQVDRHRAVLQERVEQRRRHEQQARPSLGAAEAREALELARRRRDEAARLQVEVGGRLLADDGVRRQRDEIAPRLEAAERDLAVWQALDDLIGSSDGDAFVVFAQGLTLDLLLVEANRRLAELARRYRLERNPGGEMDFVVVDLDLGASRRGLQTLSGGETFLVSLSLALALATLAAPRSRVETLFLDEGFGTLDAHSLETALGALDSLQATGCQVGVISHVEGFAERIGAAVEVRPSGGGQSRVLMRLR